MKPNTKFSILIISLIVVSGAQLYMCTSEPSRRGVSDFPGEQKTLTAELTALQQTIDLDLQQTTKEIQASSEEAKTRLVRVTRALLREKSEVQKALMTVNSATTQNWRSVRKDARYTLDDSKRTCLKLEKNFTNPIARK
jgi:hypothetical protein